jgi:rhodanese-related sulfurtransferase
MANNGIERIAPAHARQRQQSGAILIDVREDDERAAGKPAGAIGVPLGEILGRIADIAPGLDTPLLLSCAHGQRSLHAAMALHGLGYTRLASVEGGFVRWAAEGLPVDRGTFDADAAERYSRHLLLPEVGAAGQQRLLESRVALIGAGGLGSPAGLYLAAAGVGTLTLIDDDIVEKSNLQRQVLHTNARVGQPKTESARVGCSAHKPDVRGEAIAQRKRAENVED